GRVAPSQSLPMTHAPGSVGRAARLRLSVPSREMEAFVETEDQSTLRKYARDLAERELAPRAAQWDETEEFPQASWDALKAAGLFGVTVSEEHGGMGMGDV